MSQGLRPQEQRLRRQGRGIPKERSQERKGSPKERQQHRQQGERDSPGQQGRQRRQNSPLGLLRQTQGARRNS